MGDMEATSDVDEHAGDEVFEFSKKSEPDDLHDLVCTGDGEQHIGLLAVMGSVAGTCRAVEFVFREAEYTVMESRS